MEEYRINDIANDLLILNKKTIEKLFELDNCVDCVALYMFLYKTAKWQKTNIIKANDLYIAKCLKWGKNKVTNVKKILKENGLINIVQRRKNGKIDGWYIEVSYLVDKKVDSETINNEIDNYHNLSKQEVVETRTCSQNTNAYKYTNKCLNTNKLNTNNKITTNIYIYLETNFARTISSAEVQKLDEWLLLFDEEIIRYAIDLSCLNNKKTMVYINGILKNWKTCGYKTLQEIKANSVQNNSNNKKPSLSKLSFNEIDKLREEGKIDENGEWIYE